MMGEPGLKDALVSGLKLVAYLYNDLEGQEVATGASAAFIY